ncbi:putative glycolipid-binding domain-containing protein [Pseudonocardia phyllosphaerae]|uniref:putative glycolipid-binding domain-containing protein n=1 Tax=Pseudonocardia phyllosphaerae TaxID=3390502 RepID=UPI00397B20C7
MAEMLSWRFSGDDGEGLESVRISPSATGLRAVGRLIRGIPSGVLTASYRLVVAADGTLSRLSVDVATGDGEKQLTLSRSADGVWLVDDGSGGTRGGFSGACDVDLAFSPVFAALPIRRLRLHREPAEHVLPMVFVNLPDLAVEATEQTYRTVKAAEGDESAVVAFSSGAVEAELTVDADGFVLDGPGIGSRTSLDARR